MFDLLYKAWTDAARIAANLARSQLRHAKRAAEESAKYRMGTQNKELLHRVSAAENFIQARNHFNQGNTVLANQHMAFGHGHVARAQRHWLDILQWQPSRPRLQLVLAPKVVKQEALL